MRFIDHNTDPERFDESVAPLIQGLLCNTQIYDEGSEPRVMTQALKHESRLQNRRDPSPYTGDSDFVNQILQIFDFDTPLEFQTQSWELIEKFDSLRRQKKAAYGGVFAAPTGFGKTEAFLGALYQLLADGTQESAALVYPRTALLQDQLGRILKHIHQMEANLSSESTSEVAISHTNSRTSLHPAKCSIGTADSNWRTAGVVRTKNTDFISRGGAMSIRLFVKTILTTDSLTTSSSCRRKRLHTMANNQIFC